MTQYCCSCESMTGEITRLVAEAVMKYKNTRHAAAEANRRGSSSKENASNTDRVPGLWRANALSPFGAEPRSWKITRKLLKACGFETS